MVAPQIFLAVPVSVLACPSDETGYPSDETAVAVEKWYGFSKSGTTFQKVVPLFRVLAVPARRNSCPVAGTS